MMVQEEGRMVLLVQHRHLLSQRLTMAFPSHSLHSHSGNIALHITSNGYSGHCAFASAHHHQEIRRWGGKRSIYYHQYAHPATPHTVRQRLATRATQRLNQRDPTRTHHLENFSLSFPCSKMFRLIAFYALNSRINTWGTLCICYRLTFISHDYFP